MKPEFPVLKVLHLDDDPFELERVKTALTDNYIDCHFAIESVLDHVAFKDKLKTLTPDVVLLDIHMGDDKPDGYEMAAYTREATPSTVVLMCSTADDVQSISRCLNNGADDFISKSTDKGQLSLRVYNAYKLKALKLGIAEAPTKSNVVGATMESIAGRVPNIINSAVTAIFVRGESGTGKEVVSDIFADAMDGNLPFIKVNCGAIAPTLLESELFGHVKGAFTGASTDKRGLVESASGGWLFLDEVATLSKTAQVALLRVLENQEVRRVGSSTAKKVKIRVLSATNEDIPQMIESGTFRADLWQRLCEVEIELPPLRERTEEIPAFVSFFCKQMAGGPYTVSPETLGVLKALSWQQGNIRELRNCLRAMTEMHSNKMLTPLALPSRVWEELGEAADEPSKSIESSGDEILLHWRPDQNFDDLVSHLLLALTERLSKKNGRMSLRGLSAAIGMSRSTLSGRLKALVHKGLIPIEDLGKMVGISEK